MARTSGASAVAPNARSCNGRERTAHPPARPCPHRWRGFCPPRPGLRHDMDEEKQGPRGPCRVTSAPRWEATEASTCGGDGHRSGPKGAVSTRCAHVGKNAKVDERFTDHLLSWRSNIAARRIVLRYDDLQDLQGLASGFTPSKSASEANRCCGRQATARRLTRRSSP